MDFRIMTAIRKLMKNLGSAGMHMNCIRSWNFNDTEKFNTDVMKKLVDLKQQRPLTGKTVTAFLKRFPSDLLKIPMFYVLCCLFAGSG